MSWSCRGKNAHEQLVIAIGDIFMQSAGMMLRVGGLTIWLHLGPPTIVRSLHAGCQGSMGADRQLGGDVTAVPVA